MILIACTFSFIFLFCEIGERFQNSFIEINAEIGRLDWYLFPMDVVKMLSTVMGVARKPVALRGLGETQYDREQFKKVKLLCIR